MIGVTDRHRALQFASTLLSEGHALDRVFFYNQGVFQVTNPCVAAAWRLIAADSETELVVCSSALDDFSISCPEGFAIVGLGALAEAGINSDRIISFG